MLNDFYFNNTNIVGKINVIGIDVIVSINNFFNTVSVTCTCLQRPVGATSKNIISGGAR